MLDKIKNKSLLKTEYFVNGVWKKTEKYFIVTNPSNGKEIAKVSYCLEKQTKQAILSAKESFETWKNTLARYRSELLMKWYHSILENQTDLATILTTEQGKPLAEAKGEVLYAANFIRWFAEESVRAYGDLIPTHNLNSRILVHKKPVGVVGIITPWNFPLAMITRKIGAALGAGCTSVIKPSELTPLSAIALVSLAEQAGFPNGCINLVFGDPVEIGETLTDSKDVHKISFTGSTKVGKILMKQSSGTVKRLSLELGGNAPFIVFEDADLDVAVNAVIATKFRNTGQTCVCANRIFIQENILETFVQKLKTKLEALKAADGFEKGANQGPLINESAVKKVELHIQDALQKGAKLVLGGKRKKGLFFEPTILIHVSLDALVNNEETFGPVAPIFFFSNRERSD